jgi:hypothetical protein
MPLAVRHLRGMCGGAQCSEQGCQRRTTSRKSKVRFNAVKKLVNHKARCQQAQ